jgi:choice-of-anchor B domain-containing protein
MKQKDPTSLFKCKGNSFFLRGFFVGFICLFSFIIFAQDFKNVKLLDHWRTDTLLSAQGIYFNEVWHFERNERDYAIIGSTEGTHFFEVTAEDHLRFIDFVPGDFRSAQVHNRDFRDFGDYVYAVADQGNASALQIINIAHLPDSVFLEKTDSTNWNRAHTISIDNQSALMYACTFRPPIEHPDWFYRPLKVFSLADPLNPALVFSGFDNLDEVHYAYVRGDTAYLNCGFDGLRIYNFSNPSSPVLLGSLSVYNDQGYNHSGWLSEDGKTYFFTDESNGKRIKMVDVSDIANPQIVRNFGTANFQNAVAHHCIPVGDMLFVSYYNEGLRIFDTRTSIREIAHYDTYPLNSNYFMNGAWGVLPFKNGRRILVSDRTFGLFLFGFDYALFAKPRPEDPFVFFPNPVKQDAFFVITMQDLNLSAFTIEIHDASGKLVFQDAYNNQTFAEIQAAFARGLYHVSISYLNYLNEAERKFGKLVVVP